MAGHTFKHAITSSAALAEIIGTPSQIAIKKQLSALDDHMISFIAQSPFLMLATAGPDGRCDVSPRGDGAGLVKVFDRHTLLLPERAGNRRADSLRNVIETGLAGLLFLIPGVPETLRVNGRAQVIRDEEVLGPLAVQGKVPLVGIAVEVEECFLQCGRALLRSGLWDHPEESAPADLPSFGQMLIDQTKLDNATAESLDEQIQKAYHSLY